MSDSIKIGLMGLGTVGSGVWELLEGSKTKGRAAKFLQIKKILVQDLTKNREVDVRRELLTTDPRELLQDRELDIIVELIGGITPAREYILQAFQQNKDVVTANKDLIARCGDELLEKADEQGVNLLFSASAGGGIPVISALENKLIGDSIRQISGILNGTSNFILSRMKEGLEFNQALLQAQKLGYAEQDPEGDISGRDAAYKLAILASLAFGRWVDWQEIKTEGITDINPLDLKIADRLGYSCKLLCQADNSGEDLSLCVEPVMIPKNQALAGIENEDNGILIRGKYTGDIFLAGPGAGSLPTAGSVISDIFKIAEIAGVRYGPGPIEDRPGMKASERTKSRAGMKAREGTKSRAGMEAREGMETRAGMETCSGMEACSEMESCSGESSKSKDQITGGGELPLNLSAGIRNQPLNPLQQQEIYKNSADPDLLTGDNGSDDSFCFARPVYYFRLSAERSDFSRQTLEEFISQEQLEIILLQDDFGREQCFVLIVEAESCRVVEKFCRKVQENKDLTLESSYPVSGESEEDY